SSGVHTTPDDHAVAVPVPSRVRDKIAKSDWSIKRWWPNLIHLRVAVPDWLPPLAHGLVVHSEQARLHGARHCDALTDALTTLTR
ncbi:hypothetical protein ACIHCL_36750, partial [Streptomyces sp. NPDC052042]